MTQTRKIAEWQVPEECVACGAEHSLLRGLATTEKEFRGETFPVEHHEWKCKTCGVAVLGDAEIDEALKATLEAYQAAHELLTGAQVREARARRGWTQEILAAKTGLGVATIKRLELGSTVQTKVNDDALQTALREALETHFIFLTVDLGVTREEHWTESWNAAEWGTPCSEQEKPAPLATPGGELCLASWETPLIPA